MNALNIAMVSSEVAPLAKTGGLADVLAALPLELNKRGHHCSVFLPAYRSVFKQAKEVEDLHIGFTIPVGSHQIAARILKTTLHNGAVPVYLIDQPQLFDRDFLYGDRGGDYPDNCARFVFFNRAVLEAIRCLRLPVHLIHCHDWQAGLIPAYLKSGVIQIDEHATTPTVMTIHNLAYQGRYWAQDYPMTGLPWELFTAEGLEFYNDLCFLKSGIVYADQITTVSPHYAAEIQRTEFGCGLDGVLRNKKDRLTGIVNGVDYEIWNPATDTHLPTRFSKANWSEGKRNCKLELLKEFKLGVTDGLPLIGMVGRLASQKGWDITIPVIERWLERGDAQFVILGSGEERFQNWLNTLSGRFKEHIGISMTFSEPLAHRIEAASDIFLMPSAYEPCGLNQLYSLRYGTVPVVHAVGGLVDTVQGFHGENGPTKATGFSFHAYNSGALDGCLSQAVTIYRNQPKVWAEIVLNGMSQNWSWESSATSYERVYDAALSTVRQT